MTENGFKRVIVPARANLHQHIGNSVPRTGQPSSTHPQPLVPPQPLLLHQLPPPPIRVPPVLLRTAVTVTTDQLSNTRDTERGFPALQSSSAMAARFEPPEAEADLQHLNLERVDDSARHSKTSLEVDLGSADDARPSDLPHPTSRVDEHHERDDVNHHNHHDADQSEKHETLVIPTDPPVNPVEDIPEPTSEHPDANGTQPVTTPQDVTTEQVHTDAIPDAAHAVIAEHAALDTHVETVSLAQGTVSATHPPHLAVIMPTQQPMPSPSTGRPTEPQQPVKKKRKTYSNEEERRQARILKNRRTAEESRQRRMKKMKELEEYVANAALREKELQEEARVAKAQLQVVTTSMEQVVNEKDALIAQKDAEIQRLRERLQMK